MKSALEIAHEAKLRPIADIAKAAGILPEELEQSGQYRGKVSLSILDRLPRGPNGKLVIVTAITPTKAGEGKTTTSVALTHGAGQDREEGDAVPARAVDGARVRREGRRHRRRLLADRADGGHQPPLQRRLPRRDRRAQPAGRGARRVDLQRQPAAHRSLVGDLAAHAGHERSRAALHGGRARRQDARRAAREPVRHHRGVGSDGGVRAVERPGRTCGVASAASSSPPPTTASR